MTDGEARYRRYLDELHRRHPRLRLIPKSEALLQRSIGRALALLTLGGQRRYLTDYVTTIGARVYLPVGWERRSPEERHVTMRHEAVHLAQFARFGLLPMALAYLLLPLPVGLAWCRYRLERAAYEETLRAAAELFGPAKLVEPAFRRRILRQFTGPAYAWMWPFPGAVARWYDAAAARLGAPTVTS